MGVSLTKGQTVGLTKVAADAGKTLSKLTAGAGWDAADDGKEIDLDLLAVYLGEDGKAIPDANNNGSNADEALTFFNNKDVAGAHHTGDNLTGEGEGDDEQIEFTLANIPAIVKEVAVVVASYSGQTFGEVKSAFVRMVNTDGNEELAKYELGADHGSTKAVELGRLVRNGDQWDFKATGVDVAGNFNAVVASYGVTV
jgi:tellurium resistance protein TerD